MRSNTHYSNNPKSKENPESIPVKPKSRTKIKINDRTNQDQMKSEPNRGDKAYAITNLEDVGETKINLS